MWLSHSAPPCCCCAQISNFFADAWLTPSGDASITLVPHALYDPATFLNLRQLSAVSARDGYSGGTRLLMALLHRFFLHCRTRGVTLPEKGFSLRYHTIVPRQVRGRPTKPAMPRL